MKLTPASVRSLLSDALLLIGLLALPAGAISVVRAPALVRPRAPASVAMSKAARAVLADEFRGLLLADVKFGRGPFGRRRLEASVLAVALASPPPTRAHLEARRLIADAFLDPQRLSPVIGRALAAEPRFEVGRWLARLLDGGPALRRELRAADLDRTFDGLAAGPRRREGAASATPRTFAGAFRLYDALAERRSRWNLARPGSLDEFPMRRELEPTMQAIRADLSRRRQAAEGRRRDRLARLLERHAGLEADDYPYLSSHRFVLSFLRSLDSDDFHHPAIGRLLHNLPGPGQFFLPLFQGAGLIPVAVFNRAVFVPLFYLGVADRAGVVHGNDGIDPLNIYGHDAAHATAAKPRFAGEGARFYETDELIPALAYAAAVESARRLPIASLDRAFARLRDRTLKARVHDELFAIHEEEAGFSPRELRSWLRRALRDPARREAAGWLLHHFPFSP